MLFQCSLDRVAVPVVLPSPQAHGSTKLGNVGEGLAVFSPSRAII